MKIRLDFVSNSSSSSFMLVGNSFNDEELEDIAKKNGIQFDEEDIEHWDIAEKLAEKFNIDFEKGISEFYDCWCFGLEYKHMKDDETKKQFESKIKKILDKMTQSEVDVSEMTDGGYEG